MSEAKHKTVQIPQMNSRELEIALSTVVRSLKTNRGTMIVLSVLLVVSLAFNYYLVTREIKPDAFGLTEDGRVYPLSRIEGDIFKQSVITDWAKRNAEKMYDFNFRTVSNSWLDELNGFLFPKVKEGWVNSLRSKGYIKDVIEKSGFMYANVDGPVVFIGTQFVESAGMDVSVVEVPLKVVLDARGNVDKNREFKVALKLKIGHVGFKDPKYKGLAIGSFEFVGRK